MTHENQNFARRHVEMVKVVNSFKGKTTEELQKFLMMNCLHC